MLHDPEESRQKTTDSLTSGDSSSASSLDSSATPATPFITRTSITRAQPITFDFVGREEARKILGLEKVDSFVSVENKIQEMLGKLASSSNLEREKRALNSVIVLFAHSIDTEELQRRFKTTDQLELSSIVISATQPNERTAFSGILKLFWRVLHDEVVAYLTRLFPVYTEMPYMFDHLYLKNRQDVLPHQKLPIIPLSCEAARNILGVSESASEKEIAERIDELIELLPTCGKDNKPSVYDIYGSILLLGSENQNGLSIDSDLFMLPFFNLVPEYFEAILAETNLDDATMRTVIGNAAELCLTAEQFKASAQSGEPTTELVKLLKGFSGPWTPDPAKKTASDGIRDLRAAAKHIQQTKARTLEEMRKKRAEDQKEMGKVRGILKRTEAALKRAESRLAQEKAKSKQDTSSFPQPHTRNSSSPDLSPTLLPKVPSLSPLPSPPPVTSPVIDFTIQRLVAENAELKRQLEEEKAKNRALRAE